MNKSDIPQHINSRQLAKDNGYGFFHGTVCRNGHDGFRYVSGHCVQCQIDKTQTEKVKNKKAEYRASEHGKAVTKKYNTKYYNKNYDYNLGRVKNWQKENKDKVKALRKKNAMETQYKYVKLQGKEKFMFKGSHPRRNNFIIGKTKA